MVRSGPVCWLTLQKYGHIQQLAGPLPLQFVGSVSVLGQGAAPVHPTLAEPLDEHSFWGHPQQDAPLQMGQEATHGFNYAWLQGNQGWGGEGELLGATGAVDPCIAQGNATLEDETAIWAACDHLHHQLAMVEQPHLHAEVWTHNIHLVHHSLPCFHFQSQVVVLYSSMHRAQH